MSSQHHLEAILYYQCSTSKTSISLAEKFKVWEKLWLLNRNEFQFAKVSCRARTMGDLIYFLQTIYVPISAVIQNFRFQFQTTFYWLIHFQMMHWIFCCDLSLYYRYWCGRFLPLLFSKLSHFLFFICFLLSIVKCTLEKEHVTLHTVIIKKSIKSIFLYTFSCCS